MRDFFIFFKVREAENVQTQRGERDREESEIRDRKKEIIWNSIREKYKIERNELSSLVNKENAYILKLHI